MTSRVAGYRIGAYALGYIDDVRDPIEAIRPSTGAMSFGTPRTLSVTPGV